VDTWQSLLTNGVLHAGQAHQAAVVSGGGVVKIPMRQTHVRSLNLSVSVGVGVYEAIRQLDSV
jgi:tRNA (cytidine/uridine-2'-O-)-methyltransferase